MWRRRIVWSVTVLGAVSAIATSCSSSAPIDINFGKEAGTEFDAPVPVTGSGGAGGNGDAGAGGSGGDDGAADAGIDTETTGDTASNRGGTFNFHWNRPEIDDNQLHYPNYLPNAGRA